MSNLFNKLPGYTRTPPGMERVVLRWLPRVVLGGSILLALPSPLVRLLLSYRSDLQMSTLVTTVDIHVISLEIFFWFASLTVAIGALVVLVMKGPAYVADAYPLVDIESPATSTTIT